jgi:predicted TIM-barrel fold metal-dependent hydrolase
MIVDSHCHLVPTREGLDQTLARMKDSGIDFTVLVPGGMVPPLGMADFLRGREPLITQDPPNQFVLKAIREFPGQFAAFFHVDPAFHDEDDLEKAVADGFCGFKLSPLVNRVAFASRGVQMLCAFAHALEKPLYTHVVASGEASLDALEPLLRAYSRLPLILGHMGFAGTDASAIRLARRYDNLFLETSVGSYAAISEAAHRLGPTKLLYGSEGPVHHPGAELKKLELLRLSSSAMERICSDNIKELIQFAERGVSHEQLHSSAL